MSSSEVGESADSWLTGYLAAVNEATSFDRSFFRQCGPGVMRVFPRKQSLRTWIVAMVEADVLGSCFFLRPPFTASTTEVIPRSFSAGHPCCRKDFQLLSEVFSEASVGEARVWKAMSLSRGSIYWTELATFAGNPFPARIGASVPNRKGIR
jgi:hypothetical protein